MLERTPECPTAGIALSVRVGARALSVAALLLVGTVPAAFAAFTTATARSVFAPLFLGAARVRDDGTGAETVVPDVGGGWCCAC